METIKVGYSPALGIEVGGYYASHKYILYTDSNGNQYVARGGPDSNLNLVTEVVPYNQDHRDWDAEGNDPRETTL